MSDPFTDACRTAAELGGFAINTENHCLLYTPPPEQRESEARLVVTFDNLASPKIEGQRGPWGWSLLHRQGWAVLGVMARRGDFFRNNALFEALERLRDQGFFARFADVSMYGSSMGGYAACSFARLAPGCTVMAFAPQSTLNRRIAPFERRYPYAFSHFDWDGRYNDAAEGIVHAGRASLLFDPMVPEDKAHVARLSIRPGLNGLACPFMGHKLPPALKRLDLLKQVALEGLTGTLDADRLAGMLRARKSDRAHALRVAEAARDRNRPSLALRAVDYGLRSGGNWKLRRLRRELREQTAPTP